MKNREHYSEEILDIACFGRQFAADKRTGEVVLCDSLDCKNCLFHSRNGLGCGYEKKEWSEKEYKDSLSVEERPQKDKPFTATGVYFISSKYKPEWHFIKKIQLSEDCIYYVGLMVPRGEQVLLLTEQGLELDTADEDIDCQLVNRGDFDGVIAWLSVKDIIPSLNQEGNK